MDNPLPKSSDGPTVAEIQSSTAFGRFVNAVADGAAVLSGVAIIAILAIVCAEVVLRQFNRSMQVTDEIGGYLNAAAVFLALGYTLRDGGFIRVEIFYDHIRGALKQAVRWLIVLTGLVYVMALLYFTVIHVYYLYQKDVRAVSVIETPEWIPQTVAVAGLAVLLLQLVAFVVNRVRNVP